VNAPGWNEIRFNGMSVDYGRVPFDAIVAWENDHRVVCRAGGLVSTVLKTRWYSGNENMAQEAVGKYRPLVYEDMEKVYEAFSTIGLDVKKKAKRSHFDAYLREDGDGILIRKSYFN